MSKQIGILAVQGAFIEHAQTLNRLGVSSYEIRQASDLARPMDGLILPDVSEERMLLCRIYQHNTMELFPIYANQAIFVTVQMNQKVAL